MYIPYNPQKYGESNSQYKKRMAERHNESYEQAKKDAIVKAEHDAKLSTRVKKKVNAKGRAILAGFLGAALAVGN